MSTGSATSACATRSRCCSPPESRPIGRVRVRRRPDLGERGVDARAILVAEAAEAPAVAVETEPHEVAAAQDDVAVEDALLRHVADAVAALLRRASLHHDAAGARLEQPEQDADQRRLAGAVRPEHGEQLAPLELEAEPFEQRAVAEPEREVVDGDDAHLARAAASARACASCHCWKVRCGGRVSVTGTTGMPALLRRGAQSRGDGGDGLAVVEQHPDAVLRDELRSWPRRPEADGSVPSSIGRVNESGARLRSPAAATR